MVEGLSNRGVVLARMDTDAQAPAPSYNFLD